MTIKRLTNTQHAALVTLSKTVCYTANCAYGESTIGGFTAKQLVERGLAEYIDGWQIGRRTMTRVRITDAGKAVLEAHDRRKTPQ